MSYHEVVKMFPEIEGNDVSPYLRCISWNLCEPGQCLRCECVRVCVRAPCVFFLPDSSPAVFYIPLLLLLLLLLLSRFSRVRLCVTPLTAAHQAPPSLGFSRQECSLLIKSCWRNSLLHSSPPSHSPIPLVLFPLFLISVVPTHEVTIHLLTHLLFQYILYQALS